MPTRDPRYPDESDTCDAPAVQHLSALQFINHLHHHTRAPVTSTLGWSELLANGQFGFANSEQQELINHVRTSIIAIAQAHQEMAVWLAARIDQDGTWISDAYGSHPSRLH